MRRLIPGIGGTCERQVGGACWERLFSPRHGRPSVAGMQLHAPRPLSQPAEGKLEGKNEASGEGSGCFQPLCFCLFIYLYIYFCAVYLALRLLLCYWALVTKKICNYGVIVCLLVASGCFLGGQDELQQYEDNQADGVY